MLEHDELAPDVEVEMTEAGDDGIREADTITPEEEAPSSDIRADSTAEELERLRKQMREFQARADRAEAELKKLRRQGMDETERLRDELAEKEQELRQYEAMLAQLAAERRRAELIREYNIPPDFEKFVPVSYDEEQMRSTARELAEKLQQLTRQQERAPRTGGGSPTVEMTVDHAIKEAIEKGDVRGALLGKLSKLRGG